MYRFIFLLLLVNLSNTLFGQEKLTITVGGACGMCSDRIEAIAKNTIGVNAALYDLETNKLTLTHEPIFVKKELIDALLAAGHDADGQKAIDAIYNELPGCCLYRPEGMTSDAIIKKGNIFEKNEKGKDIPVIGAIVSSVDGTSKTLTDENGGYTLSVPFSSQKIIVNYVGYQVDTIDVTKSGSAHIVLSNPIVLEGVNVIYRKKSTEVSFLDPIKTQKISSKELLKAACCSLAESFDTTPAVDASITDAVTGTRKIEMLGLAGPYVQITRENMPDVRGLAAIQGLSFTPGDWVEGMQLNMGAGSVVNGFESMTGQINVEILKPCCERDYHTNAYVGQGGRLEFNNFNRIQLNENWSTGNLIHLSTRLQRRDHNHDNFLDMPLGKQLGFVNRWKWTNNNGQEGQIGAKLNYSDQVSGQYDFDLHTSDRSKVWGANMASTRAELWGKRGFTNLDNPERALGFQGSLVYHDQKSQFGLRRYDAEQISGYFNMIYQNTIAENPDHQIRMGASTIVDHFDEHIENTHYKRLEIVPGVFGEYTYKGNEKYTILAGLRTDYHNNYGLFVTPRLNIRYAPNQTTVLRLAAGRGQKTASIFAENMAVLATNRTIIVQQTQTNTPYGLDAEVAWNMGFSLTKEFTIAKKNAFFSLDINRVEFENQIVLDLENAREARFYNLDGQSYANSVQGLFEISPTKWIDLRLAARYNDVKTTYGEDLLRKPLASPFRTFANLEIKPGKGWSIDYTINRLSSTRLPSTAANPTVFQVPTSSPVYFLSNAQVTKTWKNNFSCYFGGENIFNYQLHRPIIGYQQPFGTYFDSSLLWGPVMGINLYAGVRYSIDKK